MTKLQAPKTANLTPNDEIVRVLLVDEREAMRAGLRQMLSGDDNIVVVGEARDGEEALTRVKELSPDMILMDARIRPMNSIDVIRHLKEARLPVSIIILSDSRRYLAPAIKAGAVGFLTRTITRGELIAAIRIIHLWRVGLFHSKWSHFALVKL